MTLRDFLEVAKPKKFIIGDIDNEQYMEPFWFEVIELPNDTLTLQLRGWMDKTVTEIDVDKGVMKLIIK